MYTDLTSSWRGEAIGYVVGYLPFNRTWREWVWSPTGWGGTMSGRKRLVCCKIWLLWGFEGTIVVANVVAVWLILWLICC